MKVEYKGVDITSSVLVKKCWHEMYAEGHADIIRMIFDNKEALWDRWAPALDDEIKIIHNGITTGKMFVRETIPEGVNYTITAASTPESSKNIKSKAWQSVRLTQIGREVAGNHDLEFEGIGIPEIIYPYIRQNNENDFCFLHKRCILEGCAFLVFDKKLVMYKRSKIEEIESENTIDLTNTDHRFLNRNVAYNLCEFVKGDFHGKATCTSGTNKSLMPWFTFSVSSESEANRYAENMLKYKNKLAKSGYFRTDEILSGYAPASVFVLRSETEPSWNGKGIVTKVRNEYVTEKSKIFFRKIEDWNAG